ncbi:MAG: cytochrome D ubiquinol oxidase subunit II, partial [Deltaproteobacteria bacterium]|nr:cytochrome D ubiquinol oxidase subunit II [Deltaproteobacteria bacterium]
MKQSVRRNKSTVPVVESELVAWIDRIRGNPNEDLLSEMVRSVLKLTENEASRGDLKILNRALKELRYAFKVFAPYRAVRKVSIFGS